MSASRPSATRFRAVGIVLAAALGLGTVATAAPASASERPAPAAANAAARGQGGQGQSTAPGHTVRASTPAAGVARSRWSQVADDPAPQALQDADWGDDDTREDEAAAARTGQWDAAADLGSLHALTRAYGARDVWASTDGQGRALTGAGVGVALIDTGIAPVAGLDGAGKVVHGPDLSFESQADGTRHLDGYGHGTHMAGIIAGRDGDAPLAAPSTFTGVAPDARLVNVKVGAADGGADVSQIIAAIDWVVAHRNDDGLNIRVINLSYGTASAQHYTLDPLAHAVENAWRHGIVVVVAAGNDGADSPALTMPAADPYVVAVGAVDHNGTADMADDTVAEFTNPGDADRRPDLLAPGKSVVSLRVPGSMADTEHPEGLVTGDDEGRYFRGSGTSQAAAVVSGSVALMLQRHPGLTPDQVKSVLTSTARPLAQATSAQGAGVIDIAAAVGAAASAPAATQSWPVSTGLGSLDASRGGSHVAEPETGAVLTGEVDALGSPWDARRWSTASAQGTAWNGGEWNARRWSGDSWTGGSWTSGSWLGAAWTGSSWTGTDWQARRWSGDTWTARRWSGTDWEARRWSEASWLARRWSGA